MSNKPFLKKLLKLEQQQCSNIQRRKSNSKNVADAIIVYNDLDERYVEVCSETGIIFAHGDHVDYFAGNDDCDWVYSLVDDLLQ